MGAQFEPGEVPDFIEDIASWRSLPAEAAGREFFGVDQTDRQRRLQVRRLDGAFEVVIARGPKEEDPGEPAEVLQLDPQQAAELCGLTMQRDQLGHVSRALAAAMAKGESDPVRLAAVACAAIVGVPADDLTMALAEDYSRASRERAEA